ncbi:MAG: methyltransferase domain-containing protein [Lentisphaerae bacterium]|nr:methyltransferase domain-containing protein [Lentisphaerota bacterium]
MDDDGNIESHYDRIWDSDPVPPYVESLLPAMAGLGLRHSSTVLDVGCGNGVLGRRLMDLYGCRIYGTDISPVALKAASARGYAGVARTSADPLARFRQPFPGQRFDVVVLSAVLEHVFDPAALIAASHSALKPGGFIVVLTPNVTWFLNRLLFLLGMWEHPLLGGTDGHIRYLNRRMLQKLVTDAGFGGLDWSFSSMAALPPGQNLHVRGRRVPLVRRLAGRRARVRPSLWAENFILLARKPVSDPDTSQWADLAGKTDLMPLKILHIAATPNGANWMFEITRDLRSRGHDAAALISPGQGDLAPKLQRAGVPYHVFDLDVMSVNDYAGIVRRVLKLARFLREHRFDVVHYHLFTSVILGRVAAYIADVPLRFSMCTGPFYLEAPATREVDRRTFWMDTKVIPSCEFSRKLYLEMGLPARRMERIFYGADPSAFDPAKADGGKLRREYGIPDNSPIVSMVAYFYSRLPYGKWTPPQLQGRAVKGHDTVLEAAKLVLQRNPRARFLLVGRGWEAGGEEFMLEMKSLAKSLGIDHAVIFTGMRRDIPDVLAGSDVTIQSSRSENLGGSIEALLMARPTVASAVGGLVDAVRHEETGLLVPMDDAPALAAAILRLLDNPEWAATLGRNGRALMLRDFTLSRTVDDLDQLYRTEAGKIMQRERPSAPGPAARRYRPSVSLLRLMCVAVRLGFFALCFDLPDIAAGAMRRRVAGLKRPAARNAAALFAGLGRDLIHLTPLLLPAAAISIFLTGTARMVFLAALLSSALFVRLKYAGPAVSLVRLATKRVFDLLIVAVIAAAGSPLWIAAVVAAKRLPGPALVRSPRIGRFGIVFDMFTLRSRLPDSGAAFFARLLRRIHAWNAPAIINVARGEMSIVGPRPVSPEPAAGSSGIRRKPTAKPGLVGWAEVRMPAASAEEEMRLDLWYEEHQSFWLDAWTVLKAAAGCVMRGSAASAADHCGPGREPPQ